MKTFKCGKCKKIYGFDENQINRKRFYFTCKACGFKNEVRRLPSLELKGKNSEGIKFNLKPGENLIGRSTDCHIVITGVESISRMHAKLTVDVKPDSLAFFIEDLNSSNGTFVNGVKLKPNEPHQLKTPEFTLYDKFECSIEL
jgi:hypothetical protein